MAFLVTHFWPGGTDEQYKATVKTVHPVNGLPAGQHYHAAGRTEGGYLIAAQYIASQFTELGLKPAGDNGTYFQNVRFRKIELDRERSSFTLSVNGREQALRPAEDYIAPCAGTCQTAVRYPIPSDPGEWWAENTCYCSISTPMMRTGKASAPFSLTGRI